MTYRLHLQRTINGTSQVEQKQIVIAPGDQGLTETTFTKAGASAVKRTEEVISGESVSSPTERGQSWMEIAVQAGWQVLYASQVADERLAGLEPGTLAMRLKCDGDLLCVFADLARRLPELKLGVALEKEGLVFIEGQAVQMGRSRRSKGEQRELRYDTLALQVREDSFGCGLLALLATAHEGTATGPDGEDIPLSSLVARFAEDERCAAIAEVLGVTVPRISHGLIVRPWGHAVRPAVF